MNLRVLVVDDSIIFRKVVRDCLADISGVEVVDVAKDGQVAMEKIRRIRPDVVTLDLEMPIMDGLEVLEAIEREKIETNVIMVSSHTKQGAASTTRALEVGALDFILKPNQSDPDENRRELRRQLQRCVELLQRRQVHEPIPTSDGPPLAVRSREESREETKAHSAVATDRSFTELPGKPADREPPLDPDAICIGVSTGGPKALGRMIPALSADVNVPILIVQHMPPLFTESLAKHLDANSKLTVVEAEPGMPVCGGTVVIAPGGKQMKVGGFPGAWKIEISDDPPIRGCRPSVDYLFESASMQFRSRLIAIVMTGMGDDGVQGCASIAKRGGRVWVQDESTSTVYGMPRAVINAGIACDERSLDGLVYGINHFGRKNRRTANSNGFAMGR